MVNLMKGTSRGDVGGNEKGVIFATTDRDTAVYYADFGQADGEHEIVHFDIDESNIANLNNQDVASKVAHYVVENDEYLNDVEAIIDELTTNCQDDIEIMEDDLFIQAVVEMGYSGAKQDGHYALFADMVELKIEKVEKI